MMRSARRTWLRGAAGALGVGSWLAVSGWRTAWAVDAPRTIAVTAHRFEFLPNEIALKAGERVVLEVNSLDFTHGMNFPDLKLRADLVPGRITRIALPAMPAGTYEFLCDNFCGDKHEGMHGKLVVTD